MENKSEDVFSQKYPELTKKQLQLLNKFMGDDADYIVSIIKSVDVESLSDESLELALMEHRLMSGLGVGLVNTTRENHDLKNQIRHQRGLSKSLITGLSVSGCVILFLSYLFYVYPKYKVIPTTNNSAVCELSPEENPLLTDVSIQDFAKMGILSTYSIGYVDWRNQLDQATTRYYTSKGRASIHVALKESALIDYIIQNNLVMKSMAISVPQINEKGTEKGVSYWIVQMPLAIEFYSGKSTPADTQKFIAQVKIVTSMRDAFNPKGIGIDSLVLKPYKEPK